MDQSEARAYAVVLGKVIAALRGQRSWTQGSLAGMVGIGQSTLSRIERGQLMPDSFTFQRFAQAFSMSSPAFQALVDNAYQRTRQTASAATGRPSGSTWWKDALGVAGIVGLAGIAGFAVAALLNQASDDEEWE